jgi:hypothetical protein
LISSFAERFKKNLSNLSMNKFDPNEEDLPQYEYEEWKEKIKKYCLTRQDIIDFKNSDNSNKIDIYLFHINTKKVYNDNLINSELTNYYIDYVSFNLEKNKIRILDDDVVFWHFVSDIYINYCYDDKFLFIDNNIDRYYMIKSKDLYNLPQVYFERLPSFN